MTSPRLLWRLFAGYFTLVVLTASLVGVLIYRRVESDSLDETRIALEQSANLLEEVALPHLGAPRSPDLQARIIQLGRHVDTRFTVIAADGTVLADSDEDPARMDDHGSRPEVVAARRGGEIGESVRFSATVGERMMYVAMPVTAPDGAIRGYVRTSLPLTVIDSRLALIRASVLTGAALGAILALVVGLYFARRISRPLASMTEAAERIAAGDLERRVGVRGADEIGKLAAAFNTMADQLGERMDTITRERNSLLAILGSMVEGVIAIDRKERVVHCNAVAASVLRAAPGTSIGKQIWEVTRVREVSDALVSVLRESTDVVREVRLATSPRDRIVQLHATPLRDAHGAVAGAVAVLHDETERHRVEAMRRDFVANVSHELKTPLTVIRGAVETLLDDEEMPPARRQRFLERSQAQCERLGALVRDFLTLSRIESQQSPFDREPVDLRGPVRESAGRLASAAEKKGVVITTQVPSDPVVVLADEEAIRQVADNLVVNAIKYTPARGHVWVRVLAEGASAVLEVEDNGPGIEPRDRDRIFERFYRVDKARSRELGGTGLGLAIVKHIAIALEGEASVQSTPGKGSTFRVTLPLAPAEAVDVRPASDTFAG